MEGYISQPRYRVEGLVSASSVVTDFVYSPWEASPSLRVDGGSGVEKVGEGEGTWFGSFSFGK